SQASSTQFSQELRFQSDFDSSLNFSFGANYTKFETLIDYYVMHNALTAVAHIMPFNQFQDPSGVIDTSICAYSGDYDAAIFMSDDGPVDINDPAANCPYIDPNPVDTSKNFDGDG